MVQSMSQWLTNVYEVVDAKDTDGYVNFFAENCKFRFGNAPYTRYDGSTMTVPATTIYRMEGTLAKDCRIFVDITPLYQSADQG